MTRMEKNKYMRERIYYQRTNQHALYEEANKNYTRCGEQVSDNLVKQAKTICNPSTEEFERHFSEFHIDVAENFEDDNAIWERITKDAAFKYFTRYQELKNEVQEDKQKLQEWR